MIMRIIFVFIYLAFTTLSFAQKTYKDSIETYLKKYVKEHEVVTGKDKELMSFFPVNEKYRITAQFERTTNSQWFRMESSGQIKKNYRTYRSEEHTSELQS